MSCYDRKGNPITYDQWSTLRREKSYVTVACTEISDSTIVSTVWLGLNHDFLNISDRPVIFESMIFSSGPLDEEVQRYCTEDEAEAGHEKMVQRAHAAQAGVLEPASTVVVDDITSTGKPDTAEVTDR